MPGSLGDFFPPEHSHLLVRRGMVLRQGKEELGRGPEVRGRRGDLSGAGAGSPRRGDGTIRQKVGGMEGRGDLASDNGDRPDNGGGGASEAEVGGGG